MRVRAHRISSSVVTGGRLPLSHTYTYLLLTANQSKEWLVVAQLPLCCPSQTGFPYQIYSAEPRLQESLRHALTPRKGAGVKAGRPTWTVRHRVLQPFCHPPSSSSIFDHSFGGRTCERPFVASSSTIIHWRATATHQDSSRFCIGSPLAGSDGVAIFALS